MVDLQVQMMYDKDGKLVPVEGFALANWFSEEGNMVVGDANAGGTSVLSIAIAAGTVLEIWNIFATHYSSVPGAGRLNIMQSTTAAIGGTDVQKALIAFEKPAEATFEHLKGEKAPLLIIDNKSGSSTIYLNIEAPAFVGLALAANAVTQEYSVIVNGIQST